MRVARGLARFEGRDPPTSRQLKRSPHVGRHLRSEDNDVSMAEVRYRDGKHKPCMHPPVFAVQSQRNAHHSQVSSLSEQADDRESFRSLSERRHRRDNAARAGSARCAMTVDCHRHGTACQRPGQRPNARWEPSRVPICGARKSTDLAVPYHPL